MPHSIPALVTPEVMKWAREQAHLEIDIAAKRIGRSKDEIIGWEDGFIQPTLAQAIKAAEVYKRSLAVFYLPGPPKGYQTLQDFRRIPKGVKPTYTYELAQLIRSLEYKQEWLQEYYIEESSDKLKFIGAASLSSKVNDVADSIRKTLGVTLDDCIKCRDKEAALRMWIERAEQIGINVCREGGIECAEARGFVLSNFYAPFVYINTNDSIAGRIFTLIHEIVHLWINQSGVSNLEGVLQKPGTENDKIEVFCNKVAALVLVDALKFNELWRGVSSVKLLEEKITIIADMIKVSEEVVARRLLENGDISSEKYKDLKIKFDDRWQKVQIEKKRKQKDSKAFPSPHLMSVLYNGKVFTSSVLGAYFSGVLPANIASSLLNVKLNHFNKLAVYSGFSEVSR